MKPGDTAASRPRPFLGGWHLLVPIVALAATRDLWAPDEPRYAQIAREAFETGSLLVLHLCGDLYPDKPPLAYWLFGLFGQLGGWSGLALRLPVILATIGTALVATRIARRLLGEVAGAWTTTFFLGTGMIIWFGGRLQLDPLLSFFCLAAVDLLWTDGGDRSARTRRLLLAGLCAGLAALCKGPVAWLHVGLAVLAMRLVPSALRVPLRFPLAASIGAIVLAVAPVALWATAAALREPALWRPLFLGQHLGRATSSEAPHAGPPWDHLVEMPAYLLPWTGLVLLGIAAAWRAWRAARRRDGSGSLEPGLVRAAIWFVLVFAVFSAIPPKREVYLLPIYPAAAWFAAIAFQRALAIGRLPGWVGYGTPIFLLVLALGAGIAPHFVEVAQPYAFRALPVAVVFTAGAGAALAFLRQGNLARWADAIALAMSGAGLAAALLLVPVIDPIKSARTLALEIAARPERPSEIPALGPQPEGYRFYGGVPTVRSHRSDIEPALEREGAQFLVLVSQSEWEQWPASLRVRLTVLLRRQVGSRDVLLVGAAR